jgi:hypothetical protein
VEGVPGLLKFVFASVLIVPIAFGQVSLTTAQIAKRVSPAVLVIQGKTDSGDLRLAIVFFVAVAVACLWFSRPKSHGPKSLRAAKVRSERAFGKLQRAFAWTILFHHYMSLILGQKASSQIRATGRIGEGIGEIGIRGFGIAAKKAN